MLQIPSYVHMSTRIAHNTLENCNFVALESVRNTLNIPKRQLCIRATVAQSTYSRWMRWIRGEPGGSQPQQRSIRVLREVLAQHLSENMLICICEDDDPSRVRIISSDDADAHVCAT
jgi:hypothetical protein